jgi:Rhodanese-like domain
MSWTGRPGSSTTTFAAGASAVTNIGAMKLGPQPPNFRAIVELNTGPLVTEGVAVPALSTHLLEAHRARGALVIDLRSDREFDDAHVPGAVWIPVSRAGFGTKLAWVARPGHPVVFLLVDTLALGGPAGR